MSIDNNESNGNNGGSNESNQSGEDSSGQSQDLNSINPEEDSPFQNPAQTSTRMEVPNKGPVKESDDSSNDSD